MPGAILSNRSATIQMEFGLIKALYAIFPFGKYLSLNRLRIFRFWEGPIPQLNTGRLSKPGV
jgi:hypothetical protein